MKKLQHKATFLESYLQYEELYKYEYSKEKLDKIIDTIIRSNKFQNLCQLSANQNAAPAGRDFFGLVFTISYFIFAKADTRIMGALTALNYWNYEVNRNEKLANKKDMLNKIDDVFGNFGYY